MKKHNEEELKDKISQVYNDQASWEEIKSLAYEENIEDQMRKQWNASDSFTSEEEVGKRILNRILHPRKSSFSIKRKLQIAASVAAVICFTLINAYFFTKGIVKDSIQTYVEVHSSGNTMYQLPDSSIVWMMPGSSVRFAENFEEDRQVWLKGESVFDVKKQGGKTFKVNVNKANIAVLGTSFRVKELLKDGASEITLYSGKIQFNREDIDQNIIMSPYQKLIYKPETKNIELATIPNIKWESGRYTFVDIQTDMLIQSINSLYDVQIELGNGLSPNYLLTGSIRYDESLQDVLYKLCYSLKANPSKIGNKIIINKENENSI